jgi:hypothetical protein
MPRTLQPSPAYTACLHSYTICLLHRARDRSSSGTQVSGATHLLELTRLRNQMLVKQGWQNCDSYNP